MPKLSLEILRKRGILHKNDTIEAINDKQHADKVFFKVFWKKTFIVSFFFGSNWLLSPSILTSPFFFLGIF